MRKVLYHGNCPDGFGAAYAAWKKYGDDAEYIPVQYGEPIRADLAGHDVLIVDFSYPRDQLEALRAHAASLLVIDHHKTAAEALDGLPYAIFDMHKSGAVLTWEHLHAQPVPPLLLYVQDRDLWAWALADSKEVSAALWCCPRTFGEWDAIDVSDLATEGAAILRYKRTIIEQMAANTRLRTLGGHVVPVVNASVEFSEVGERLCELHPDAPFSAYYFDRADKRQWGMRSRGGFDCSGVAKQYGGGGHPGAAGFTSEIGWLP